MTTPDPHNLLLSRRPALLQIKSTCAGLTVLLLCLTGIQAVAQAQQEATPQPATPSRSQGMVVLYVNPTTGQDQAAAGQSEAAPYRTISYALQQAQPGTTLVLAPGTYSSESGETFPLVFKPGITLRGNPANQGETIVIQGGGPITSSYFGPQNAAILTNYNSLNGKIIGVTVTNPNKRGTGVWIESANTVVSDSTFTGSAREGVFATGSATPMVENNVFINNVANGISVTNSVKGEFRNNRFQSTGFGMAIGGTSTPAVVSNQFIDNRTGVVVSGSAQPVLRQNVFEANEKAVAIVAFSQGQPNLGTQESPGQNVFRDNTDYAIYNAASKSLISAVGNQLDPGQVAGQVNLGESLIGNVNFPDIQNNWAAPYIRALAARNIISGFPNGTFRPEEPVNRAQFAAIIAKAFMPTPEQPPTDFTDVPENFWGRRVIRTVASSDFLAGYPNKTFQPNQKIPRVQALVSLASGLNLQPGDPQLLSTYTDASRVPSYAKPKVAAATREQIVVNYPNRQQLDPLENATRADIAAFVYQALVNAGKADPIESPYVVTSQGATSSSTSGATPAD